VFACSQLRSAQLGIYRWAWREGSEGPGETASRPRPGPVDDGDVVVGWWALPSTQHCASAFALVAAERAGDTDGSSRGNWDLLWQVVVKSATGRGFTSLLQAKKKISPAEDLD
jgi:hypothetical protein